MICDELQYESLGDANKTYPASTLVVRKQFVDAAIEELKAENRKLKRALWLARAERAKECHFMWCQLIYHKKYGIVKFNVRKECFENIKQGQTLHTPQGWADVWDEVEYRCRNKAEEYK